MSGLLSNIRRRLLSGVAVVDPVWAQTVFAGDFSVPFNETERDLATDGIIGLQATRSYDDFAKFGKSIAGIIVLERNGGSPNFGTGNFTLELLTRQTAEPADGSALASHYADSAGARYWRLVWNATENSLNFWVQTTLYAKFVFDVDGVSLADFFNGDFHHVVVTRNGATLAIHVNGQIGQLVASIGATAIGNATISPRALIGGSSDTSGRIGITSWNTLMFDEIRISTVARYPINADFTPPTEKFPRGSADPNWADTYYLFGGEDPHSGLYNLKGGVWTQLHTTSGSWLGIAQGKRGLRSQVSTINFGSNFVSWDPSSDWNLGSGDFTIEVFGHQVDDVTQGVFHPVIGNWADAATKQGWQLYYTSDATGPCYQMRYSVTGSAAIGLHGFYLPHGRAQNAPHDVALVREGNTLRWYLDGQLMNTVAFTATIFHPATQRLALLGQLDGTSIVSGGSRLQWLRGARITKGSARYSGSRYWVDTFPLKEGQIDSPPSLSLAAPYQGVNAVAMWDPSDFATLYKRSNLSLPVAADQDPVGFVLDKTNRHQRLESHGMSRPTYRNVGGIKYLHFDTTAAPDDGIDFLSGRSTFGAGPFDVIMAVRRDGNAIIAHSRESFSGNFAIGVAKDGATETASAGSGTTTYQIDGTDVPGGAATTRDQLADMWPLNEWKIVSVYGVNFTSWGQFVLGGYPGEWASLSGFAGGVIAPTMTAAQRTAIMEDLAAKVGKTLPAAAPVNTAAPVISGTSESSKTLTTTNGTWANDPLRFTYQWRMDGTPVSGATNATYTATDADVGKVPTCEVTAYNRIGSTAQVSNALGAVAPQFYTMEAMLGNNTSGTTLSVSPATTIPAGSLAIVRVVSDDYANWDATHHGASGSTAGETGVRDSKGNLWTLDRSDHVQNAAATAADGVLCSFWRSIITNPILPTDTVTMTFPAALVAKGMGLEHFQFPTAVTAVTRAGTNSQGFNNAGAGTWNLTLSGLPALATSHRLLIGYHFQQNRLANTNTVDADYTLLGQVGSPGSVANDNVISRGGYRLINLNSDTFSITAGGVFGQVLSAFDITVAP